MTSLHPNGVLYFSVEADSNEVQELLLRRLSLDFSPVILRSELIGKGAHVALTAPILLSELPEVHVHAVKLTKLFESLDSGVNCECGYVTAQSVVHASSTPVCPGSVWLAPGVYATAIGTFDSGGSCAPSRSDYPLAPQLIEFFSRARSRAML